MKLYSLTVILAGIFLFSTSLDAQIRAERFGERGPRGERPDRVRLHERLNLSAEQEKQLSEIRTAHQNQMIDKRAELQKVRLAIREEMRKESPDMRDLENMIKQQETIRTDMQLARVQHLNSVREVLTPEQREIWQQHRRGFGEFGDRRGSWRRGHHRGRW